ncbi:olfactory receptor 52K1-like [Spea bombifrons]|uniref:olfactory receptor 52K1-like n=1 Tax=Spea bombifrons TaxID=233779 RepID=UPI002349FB47|nr:olfactory receptor 52K1-like [Spea bombifrons]
MLPLTERSSPNQTAILSHTEFLLYGFPGVSVSRSLLLIPFLSIYLVILAGNGLIMHRIWAEKTLHSPMYSLIFLLFAVNVSCTSAIVPKLLLGLAFGLNHISLDGCLLQMFVIYLVVTFESALVLLMALDRYVAICRPLHYHLVMTNNLLVLLTFVGLARSVLLISPIVILISRVPFCNSNVISSIACENMALLSIGCGNISRINLIGLLVRILVSIVDGSLLLVSYVIILSTALKAARGQAIHKALHTCCTHMLVAFLIYLCGLLTSVVYRLDASISVNVQNLVSAIYYLFPAAVNPVIYGLRVKEIRVCLKKTFRVKNTDHEVVSKRTIVRISRPGESPIN